MDHRSSICWCMVLSLVFAAVDNAVSQSDQRTMEILRDQLQGSKWNATDQDFCKWYGVYCNSNRMVERLELSHLGLTGNFSVLIALKALTWLDLSLNSFSGRIPSFLGQMQVLQCLDLSANHFSGTIPSEIGNMRSLFYLNLSSNALTGRIPPELSSIKGLKILNLNTNGLNGGIPEEFHRLESLQELQLSVNHLTGPIPQWISNLTSLEIFTAYENSFNGAIPQNLGLNSNLEVLNLHSNKLVGSIPESIFASGQLQVLILTMNSLDGSLPRSVGKCRGLSNLRIGSNKLTGSIPPEIGNVSSLTYFEANENSISGNLVPEFAHCSNLTLLSLASNGLTGSIPSELGSLPNLQELIVSGNSLSGDIPKALSKCKNLSKLDLSCNRFNGTIPEGLCNIPHLQYMLLNENSLRGEIPSDIGNCKRLLELQLGSNYLSGRIPGEIGGMSNLQIALNLSFNHLEGPIPTALGRLDKLVSLDVSDNKLSGAIPVNLKGMESLIDVNFSNNLFSGIVPTFRPFQNSPGSSFKGNRDLCGEPLNTCGNISLTGHQTRHKSSFGKVLGVVLGSGILVFLMVTIVVVLYVIKEKQQLAAAALDPPPTIVTGNVFVESLKQAINFESAVEATLKESNKLSSGTFSTIYKVIMPSGLVFAVRKLKSIDRTVSLHQNKMIRELEKLAKLSHENVMRPVGFVIYDDVALLLHYHLPNGTLAQLLHREGGTSEFEPDWPRRLSIALGVAEGLAFLHHCHTPIIHLDIASANIFLDANFNPLIGEVEISKLLDPSKGTTSITAVAGSFGYIPPEYAYTMQVTAAGNVYSFGVILLETLTSRLPVEEAFGEGMDLVKWVHNASSRKETPEQILDAKLSTVSFAWRQQMLAALKVALLCTDNTPAKRPKMKKVVEMLQEVNQGA
uniref:non-specific serine/threonine protein kinase n=1 Tax=Picea sitchensis TaxID=3332 RepID=B8LRM4_PICSI|nr:unknown [Picea sitchensis]